MLKIEKINKTIDLDKVKKEIGILPTDIVYLGGSLIESFVGKYSQNMGNSKSDIDVFIIREEKEYRENNAVYNQKSRKVNFAFIDGMGYDIEIFNYSDIAMIIEALQNVKIQNEIKIGNMLSLPAGWNLVHTNGFINRLKYSYPIHNERKYNEIKEKINISNFALIYRKSIITDIDNLYNDVVGNVQCGEMEPALYGIHAMFHAFVKVILYYEGEFVDRDKWIMLKFKQLVQTTGKYQEVMRVYEQIFLRLPSKTDEILQLIMKVAAYINDQIIMIEEADEWI